MKHKVLCRLISASLAVVTTFSNVAYNVYAAQNVAISSAVQDSQLSSMDLLTQAAQQMATADIAAEEANNSNENSTATDGASASVTPSEDGTQETVGQEKASESAVSSSDAQNSGAVDAAAGSETSKSAKSDAVDAAADSETSKSTKSDAVDAAAGSGTSNSKENAAVDNGGQGAGETGTTSAGNSIISDVKQNEDGTITVTDKMGGKSTINQETGEISVDVSGSNPNYVYNEKDAAGTPEGAEYIGTEESTGIAMYRKVQSELEYWAEGKETEEELEQLEEYAQMPTLSGDDLSSVMAAASSWDAQVLEERYDAVYDENAVMAADLLDDEETKEQTQETGTQESSVAEEEETAEPVGYVLKEEYQDMEPTYTDKISFSSVSTAAAFGGEDIAAISEDEETAAENAETIDDTWVSTTVCFVSDESVAIRVTNEAGEGINNASVTVKIDQNDPITMTTSGMTDGETVGDGVAIINNISGTHSAFINISAQGYRGVTRVSQEIKGGDVLTFSLKEATEGEVYLRGVSIDGQDCYDANYDLYVSKKNLSTYNIIAFVEMTGKAPSTLPDVNTLELCSNGTVIECSDAPFGKSQTDSSAAAGGYRAYIFTGQWSSYKTVYDTFKGTSTDMKPVLAIGKAVSLQWTENAGAVWKNADASEDGRSIATKINVLESYSTNNWMSTWLKKVGVGLSSNGVNIQDTIAIDQGKWGTVNLSALIPYSIFDLGNTGLNVTVDPNGFFWAQIRLCSDDRDKYNKRKQDQSAQQPAALDGSENSEQGDGLDGSENSGQADELDELGEIVQQDLDQMPPAKQWKYSELKQKVHEKYKKMSSTSSGWKYASFGKTWDWSYELSILLGGRWNLADGGAEAKIGLRLNANISGTAYTYLFAIPFYIGLEVKGEAVVATVLGVQIDGKGDWHFQGGLEILLAATVSVFAGFGAHGVLGAEASGSIGVFALINLLVPTRFRAYWGWNLRAQLNAFFFKATWTISNKTYKLFDTEKDKLNDPTDQSPSIIGGYVPFPAALENETDSLNEKAPVEQKTEESSGLAVVEAKDGDQEVTIASGGEAVVNKDSKITTKPQIDNNEKEQTVLENVTSSSSTAYVPGLFVRVANVKDEDHFDGNVVPRVTIAKTDATGIISDPIVIPATKTDDEEGDYWYGYDYAFDVYEGEKYYFLVISSSNIMPKNHTIPEIAEANRLRLILLDKDTLEIKRESVLKKSEYKKDSTSQGRTDYLYTAPIITGDNLTEDKLTDEEKNLLNGKTGYLDQSGYYIASIIMTEPSNIVKMVQNEKAEEDLGLGLYVCRGGNYELSNPDAFQDYMYIGESAPRQIAFANTDARNPQLLFTEQSNTKMLHVIGLCTNKQYPFSLQCSECTDIVMSGDVYSLQQVENCKDGGKGSVFAVIGGVLNRLQLSFADDNEYKVTVTQKEIGKSTENGSAVIMPEADTLKILYDEELEALYCLVASSTSTGMDANGNMSQDTLIRVYPVSGIHTDKPVISGPFNYTIKNRQMFQLCAAIETGKKDTDWVLRVMYLADEKQEQISTYQEGSSAEEYIPGTVSATCNLYMWELHGGRAAKLTSMSAKDTVIRKSDGSFKASLSLKNVGTERVKSVTFCVTDDKNSEDDAHYGTYTVTLPGNGIGLGSTATIEQDIDIKSGWNGTTTLYAKIIKVNDKKTSDGFTPNWVEADSLLDSGAFSISVKEEGRGENPVAHVTIENHSMVSFKNVALLVEKKKLNGNWYKAAEYNFSSLSDANATGADAKVMNVNVPLRTIWNDEDVVEARFTLVGQNDITLNNAYTITESIRHENYSDYLMVYLQADAADDSMGEVTVDSSESEAIAQVSDSEEVTEESQQNSNICYVPLDTEVRLSAEAKEGYVFDHWEIYGTEDWLYYSDDAQITVKAGAAWKLTNSNEEIIDAIAEGSRYTMRACFRVAEDKARITFIALEKVTTETKAEDGSTETTISYRSSSSLPEGTLKRLNGEDAAKTAGALGEETAYLLDASESIRLSAPEAVSSRTEESWTDDWSMLGFYHFSYEDGTCVIKEGDAILTDDSSFDGYELTLDGGADQYIAIVYEENQNPPKWVTVDYGDGTLAENVPESILRSGSSKIYPGENLRDLLPLNLEQEQLTGRYGKLLGYYIKTSDGEAAGEDGSTDEGQEGSSEQTDQTSDDISQKYVTLSELGAYTYSYDQIASKNAVIVAVYEPKGVVKLHTNYGGWGDVSFRTNAEVRVDETGTIIAPLGTKLTIEAAPKEGYRFTKWRFLEPDSGEYVDLDNSVYVEDVSTYEYTVGAEGQYDLLAVFSPTYQLKVIGGHVNQFYYRDGFAEGDQIFVIADEPKEGYRFAGWFADGVELTSLEKASNPLGITMPANDVTLIALYEPNLHTISVWDDSMGGTISPHGNVSVKDGEDCTFRIEANKGYVIDKLTVDGKEFKVAVKSYDYELKNVKENHKIVATFKQISDEDENAHWLYVQSGTGIGTGKYPAGKRINIDAEVPGAQYRFTGWSVTATGKELTKEELDAIFPYGYGMDDEELTLIMPDYDLTIAPNWVEVYRVYAVAGEHGKIDYKIDYENSGDDDKGTIQGVGYNILSAASKDEVNFTITPDAGYEISSLKVNGEEIDASKYADGKYTLTGVTKETVLGVIFQKAEEKTVYCTIDASASDGGSIKPSGTVNVPKGSDYSITATANTGYYLESLYVNGTKASLRANTQSGQDDTADKVKVYTYKLTHVDQDYRIRAEFAPEESTKYVLTVNDGNTTQTGKTEAGKKVTLTAADAPEGKVFSGWTGLDGDVEFMDGTDKSCKTISFVMPERDLTVIAAYGESGKTSTYTLTVNDGSGKPSYTETHEEGDIIKIHAAEPADGYQFAEWTGLDEVQFNDGTSSASKDASFTMPAKNLVVNVRYARRSYELTVENGTGTGSYLYGATVTIAANAASENMKFKEWSGLENITLSEGSVTDEKVSFTMPAHDLTAKAEYEETKKETKNWSIHCTVGANGSLTSDTGTTIRGKNDSIAVTEGTDCTVTITPDEGYEISSLYVDGKQVDPAVLKDGKYTFVQVQEDRYIAVIFAKKAVFYSITGTANEGGTITPGGTSSVKKGDGLAFTATAAEGYYLESLIVDKGKAGEKQVFPADTAQSGQTGTGDTAEKVKTYTYRFEKVSEDHTIEATFAKKTQSAQTYSVTVTNGTGGGEYAEGVTVTISADQASEHQKFLEWVGLESLTEGAFTDGTTSKDAKVSFCMPAYALTVTAKYAVKTHTIQVTAPGAGKGGSVAPADETEIKDGKVTIQEGTDLRFVIKPDSAYEIDSLKINGAAVDQSVLTKETDGLYSYTFRNVTDDSSSIEVSFKKKEIYYTITASASAGGILTPGGTSTVKEGGTLTYTATANDGYSLESLSVNGESVPLKVGTAGSTSAQDYTFENVIKNSTIHAEFAQLPEPVIYTLTLYNGSGAAEVRSYECGDLVTITAAKLKEVDFTGWNGLEDLESDNFADNTSSKDATVSFYMPDRDLTVTAVYGQKKYTLSVTNGTGGGSYPAGTIVTISAKEYAGKTFDGWKGLNKVEEFTGGTTGKDATVSFKMPATDVTARASYKDKVKTCSIIVTAPETGGTIEPKGTDGIVTVPNGGNVTFTITPDEGYEIDQLLIDGMETEHSELVNGGYSFSLYGVTTDRTIKVTFKQAEEKKLQYIITARASAGGRISPSGDQVVAAGNSRSYTITPNEGYYLKELKVDNAVVPIKTDTIGTMTGQGSGSDSVVQSKTYTYEFREVKDNHSIEAVFARTKESETETVYTLTVNGTAMGQYKEDAVVTIQAPDAAEGYAFDGWKGLDNVSFTSGTSKDSLVSFKMPNRTLNVEATYKKKELNHIIMVDIRYGGSISPSGKEIAVKDGGSQTFTITADEGYVIDRLEIDGIKVELPAETGRTYTFTLNNVTTKRRVYVSFRKANEVTYYTIAASASEGGTISPNGDLSVVKGKNCSFTITPGTGYYLKSLLVDGQEVSVETDTGSGTTSQGNGSDVLEEVKTYGYEFRNIEQDHTIHAEFAKVEETPEEVYYSLTVSGGTGSGQNYKAGATVKVEANAAPAGQSFAGWQVSGGELNIVIGSLGSSSMTFKMPAHDVTLTATYKDVQIDPEKPEDGGSSGSGSSGSSESGSGSSGSSESGSGSSGSSESGSGSSGSSESGSGSSGSSESGSGSSGSSESGSGSSGSSESGSGSSGSSESGSGSSGSSESGSGSSGSSESGSGSSGSSESGSGSSGSSESGSGSSGSSESGSGSSGSSESDSGSSGSSESGSGSSGSSESGSGSSGSSESDSGSSGSSESGSGSSGSSESGSGSSESSKSGSENAAAGSGEQQTDAGAGTASSGYWETITPRKASGSEGTAQENGQGSSDSALDGASGYEGEEPQEDLIHLRAVIVWEDEDDEDGIRPTSIRFHLYADGEEIAMLEASAETNWAADFGKRPKMNGNSYICYAVTADEAGEEYSLTYQQGSIADGELFTVTSVHETQASQQARAELLQNENVNEMEKDSEDTGNGPDNRLIVYGTIAAILAIVLLLLLFLVKRKKKEDDKQK